MRGQLTEAQKLRTANTRLKGENQQLRQRVAVLEAKVAEQNQIIETLKLQLEELQRIVFGKNKKPPAAPVNQPSVDDDKANDRKSRAPSSYRRPMPKDEEVTAEENKPLASSACPDCQSALINIHWVVRYLEDILLPVKKIIKRLKIQVGFCPKCRRQRQAMPVSAHTVSLGTNIQQAILYWTYVSRLSFQQIIDTARDLYDFKLSDGEIAHILATGSNKLEVSYEQLKQRIRGSPSLHFDETGYKQQGGEKYAWVMTPSNSEEAVFLVGRNRGKGNATELAGDFSGVRVTDCYPAYDNMTGGHQACWSHPLRYARDLASSQDLSAEKRVLCQSFYQQVKDIYAQVRVVVQQPFEPLKRTQAYEDLRKQLDILAKSPCQPAPKKLLDLKQRFKNYAHEFLTCLLYENVPADNNKAERKLRHLVLKRKVSFGTKSAKGSKIFSINASVLLSWWWSERENFFANLSRTLQRQ